MKGESVMHEKEEKKKCLERNGIEEVGSTLGFFLWVCFVLIYFRSVTDVNGNSLSMFQNEANRCLNKGGQAIQDFSFWATFCARLSASHNPTSVTITVP